MVSEQTLRSEIVRFGKLMFDRGLTFATGGNLSARLDDDTIIITPSGVRKGEMREEELLVIDLHDGSHQGNGRPSMETPLHIAFYSKEEVNAVVHGHPPFCTSLAVMGEPLRTGLIPEGALMLGKVPMVPYRTPGSEELARVLLESEGDGKGFLMEKHGALAIGASLEEAYSRLEEMEFIAMVQIRCAGLGGAKEIPPEEIDRI